MKLAVTLLSTLVAVCVAQNPTKPPYTNENDEALFDVVHNRACKKVSLGNEFYQWILTSDTKMGDFGFVYAFPPQICPPGTTFSDSQCGCVSPGQDLGRLLGIPSAGTSECNPLADISFNPEAGRYNSSTYIRYGEEQAKANLDQMTVSGADGSSSGGYALSLQGMPLRVQSFASNDLVGPWKSSLRVRPSSVGRTVVVSDACEEEEKEGGKSLEIVLAGSALEVFFRFVNDSFTGSCSVQADSNGWLDIQMSSDKTDITVAVNGKSCVTSATGASLAPTDCPLSVGSASYHGLLDRFVFQKNPEKC